MNWNDITLDQYNKIQELLQDPDDYTALNILDIVYNIDSANMEITKLKGGKYNLEFLKQPIPKCSLKKQYKLNNTTYNSNCDLTRVTMAQFIDYCNYNKDPKIHELLSVFFIPDNHTYNDGYDMKQVQTDLLQLPITVVQSAGFFFDGQLRIFARLFRNCLIREVKKMKMDKTKKKDYIKQLRKMDLHLLVQFPTYLNTALQQTQP